MVFLLAVLVLVVLYWHFLEHWFLHSTVGPNITATPPGMAVTAFVGFLGGILFGPKILARIDHWLVHHPALRRFDRLVQHYEEGGPMERMAGQIIEIVGLVSKRCHQCGTATEVGELCNQCYPSKDSISSLETPSN